MPECRVVRSDDILSLGTPEDVDLNDPVQVGEWHRLATGVTKQHMWAQFRNVVPYDLEFGEPEIVITDDPEVVTTFYGDHLETCASCRQGLLVTDAYLQQTPGATATLIRLPAVEVW